MGDTTVRSQRHGQSSSSAPAKAEGAAQKDRRAQLRGLDLEAQDDKLAPSPTPPPPQVDTGLSMKSFGTWTQSGLNQVDAAAPFLRRPLQVDGVTGPATKVAIRGFQAKAEAFVPGVGAIARSGAMDAATVWALEQATRSKNPEGRPAKAPDAIAPAPGAPVEKAADNKASAPAGPASDGGSDTAIAATMKQKIAAVPTPEGPGKAKADDAYAELKAWTVGQIGDEGDKDTKRAKKSLATQHAAAVKAAEKKGEAAPDAAEFEKKGFFKAYWMLHCDKFADALMKRINGPQYPTLMAMRAKTTKAVDQAQAEGKQGPAAVAGRDTAVRGQTMAQLGQTLADQKAEAGIAVHVKLRPEVDRPYDPTVKDEMHHWFVHVGNGLFSDSFGANQQGAKCDRFLRGWMVGKFHQRGRKGETFDYSTFHTPQYCEPASLAAFEGLLAQHKDGEAGRKKLPKPLPDFASKVSAIYRPLHAKTGAAKKEAS